MYDHHIGAWRPLRATQPVPPGRMLHAACVSGDEWVIVGGIGSQAQNVALLDIAVDQGIHMGEGSQVTGASGRRASYRRPSEVDIEASLLAQRARAGKPLSMSPQAAKLKAELSDVWVLNLRTLLWREVADAQKRFSPFVVREDALLRGPSVPTSGIASGPKLPQPYGAILELKSLDGHSAVAFNERVLVFGGTLGGKLNRRMFSLHLPSETWAYLGELPTNTSNAQQQLPLARSCAMSCAVVQRKTVAATRDAVSLGCLDAAHRHINEPSEADPFVNVLMKQLASQLSFTGTLSLHGVQPIISKTVCAYVFGGVGVSGKALSDTWCIELKDTEADRSHEDLFGNPVTLLLQGMQGQNELEPPSSGVLPLGNDDGDEDLDGRDARRDEQLQSFVFGSSGCQQRNGGRGSCFDGSSMPLKSVAPRVGGGGTSTSVTTNRNSASPNVHQGGTSVSRKGLLSNASATDLLPDVHGRGSKGGVHLPPRKGSRLSEVHDAMETEGSGVRRSNLPSRAK
jgi:hypothetical protein